MLKYYIMFYPRVICLPSSETSGDGTNNRRKMITVVGLYFCMVGARSDLVYYRYRSLVASLLGPRHKTDHIQRSKISTKINVSCSMQPLSFHTLAVKQPSEALDLERTGLLDRLHQILGFELLGLTSIRSTFFEVAKGRSDRTNAHKFKQT